jgi:hypothetical protein
MRLLAHIEGITHVLDHHVECSISLGLSMSLEGLSDVLQMGFLAFLGRNRTAFFLTSLAFVVGDVCPLERALKT